VAEGRVRASRQNGAGTRTKQFEYAPGFGNIFSAGDINGDGLGKIAAAET
jgi:hypothetical protein